MKKLIYTKESDILRKWLINKRCEENLTQRELANLLQRHHSVVDKIETGERQVKVIELIQYCKAINANPLEIIRILSDEID